MGARAVDFVASSKGIWVDAPLGFDREHDVCDGAHDFIDLSDLGFALRVDEGIETGDFAFDGAGVEKVTFGSVHVFAAEFDVLRWIGLHFAATATSSAAAATAEATATATATSEAATATEAAATTATSTEATTASTESSTHID